MLGTLTLSNSGQLAKTPISLLYLGATIPLYVKLFSLMQFETAPSPTKLKFPYTVTLFKFVQFEKAKRFIVLTLLGIETDLDLHSRKMPILQSI